MTEPAVPVLLITHPGLGEGLSRAAASILGPRPTADVLTNAGTGPEELLRRVRAWMDERPGPVLLLTDLGSCTLVARRAARDRAGAGIVSGVNLTMLLAALRPRETGSMEALVEHLTERARDGVEAHHGGPAS